MRLAGLAIAVGVVGVASCVPAAGPQGTGSWRWTETRVNPIWRSQGIATDPASTDGTTWYTSQFSLERAASDGSSRSLTGSLPLDVLLVGRHSHTGDPDAAGGRVVVPWENKQLGPSDPPSKAFGVYDGTTLELLGWSRHVLAPGETNDNPWVTVSPDGAWMVSARYAPMARLEVFPVPRAPFGDIDLVATVTLDAPAYEVQGCDFSDATTLVCASNNDETAKQVFTLELDAPIDQGASSAHLTYRGTLPQAPPLLGSGNAFCAESGEVEGIDAREEPGRGVVVRVLVIDRCPLVVHEYEHEISDR